jgi:hypothetical protein
MDFWTDIWPATLGAQQMLTSLGDDMSRLPQNVRIFLLVNGAHKGVVKGSVLTICTINSLPPLEKVGPSR